MKLLALVLVTICCSSSAPIDKPKKRAKLTEVLAQLKDVKESLQNTDLMVNTPPHNPERCCSLHALQCFGAKLERTFNVSEKKQAKFLRSLRHEITESALTLCNASETAKFNCGSCDLHPMATARDFVDRLESFIQMAITRLSLRK